MIAAGDGLGAVSKNGAAATADDIYGPMTQEEWLKTQETNKGDEYLVSVVPKSPPKFPIVLKFKPNDRYTDESYYPNNILWGIQLTISR